jgi:hypothetical protein
VANRWRRRTPPDTGQPPVGARSARRGAAPRVSTRLAYDHTRSAASPGALLPSPRRAPPV